MIFSYVGMSCSRSVSFLFEDTVHHILWRLIDLVMLFYFIVLFLIPSLQVSVISYMDLLHINCCFL